MILNIMYRCTLISESANNLKDSPCRQFSVIDDWFIKKGIDKVDSLSFVL